MREVLVTVMWFILYVGLLCAIVIDNVSWVCSLVGLAILCELIDIENELKTGKKFVVVVEDDSREKEVKND